MPVPQIMQRAAAAAGRTIRIIGIDLAPTLAPQISLKNTHFVPSEMEQLPFASETFDAATSAYAIEYSGDFPSTMLELFRVLKPAASMRLWVHEEQSVHGQGFLHQARFWYTLQSHFSFADLEKRFHAGVPIEELSDAAQQEMEQAIAKTPPIALDDLHHFQRVMEPLLKASARAEFILKLKESQQMLRKIHQQHAERAYVSRLFSAANKPTWEKIIRLLGFHVILFEPYKTDDQLHFGWQMGLVRKLDQPDIGSMAEATRIIEKMRQQALHDTAQMITSPFTETPASAEEKVAFSGPILWVGRIQDLFEKDPEYKKIGNEITNHQRLSVLFKASYRFQIHINPDKKHVVAEIPVTQNFPLRFFRVVQNVLLRHENKPADLLLAYHDLLHANAPNIFNLLQQSQRWMMDYIRTQSSRPQFSSSDVLGAHAEISTAGGLEGLHIRLFVRGEPTPVVFRAHGKGLTPLTERQTRALDDHQRQNEAFRYIHQLYDMELLKPLFPAEEWHTIRMAWLNLQENWPIWMGRVFKALSGPFPQSEEKKFLEILTEATRHFPVKSHLLKSALHQLWRDAHTANFHGLPLVQRVSASYAKSLHQDEQTAAPLPELKIALPSMEAIRHLPAIDLFSGTGLRHRLRSPSHLTPDIAVDRHGFVTELLKAYSQEAGRDVDVRQADIFSLQSVMPETLYRLVTAWNAGPYVDDSQQAIPETWATSLLNKIAPGGIFWISIRSTNAILLREEWLADDSLFRAIWDVMQTGGWQYKQVRTDDSANTSGYHHHFIALRKAA